jgi:hypothetical protein
MCTASWFFHQHGYHLFFNRDEKKSRARALPPSTFATESGTALMPIDPDGGGSWLGVNSAGWTFALLNYYQGEIPDGPLTTRGAVVRAALNCTTARQVDALLTSLPLQSYAPFSLLCLASISAPASSKPAGQREQNGEVQLWRWTGRALQSMAVTSFITSSSRHFAEACSARAEEANRTRVLLPRTSVVSDSGVQTRIASHRTFHMSHGCSGHSKKRNSPDRDIDPDMGLSGRETSVCMHRNDASTVSLSEVSCTEARIRFVYHDGAPCKAGQTTAHELTPAAATLSRAI